MREVNKVDSHCIGCGSEGYCWRLPSTFIEGWEGPPVDYCQSCIKEINTKIESKMREYHITEINPDEVKRVYSGKPGCGCGCRGKYWEDRKNIRRVVNLMKKVVTESPDDVLRAHLYKDVAAVETEKRYYWAYFA